MIQTQDGMQLINITNVSLIEAFEMCGTHKWGVRAAMVAGYVILGVYDTKEKALRVLNDILDGFEEDGAEFVGRMPGNDEVEP